LTCDAYVGLPCIAALFKEDGSYADGRFLFSSANRRASASEAPIMLKKKKKIVRKAKNVAPLLKNGKLME